MQFNADQLAHLDAGEVAQIAGWDIADPPIALAMAEEVQLALLLLDTELDDPWDIPIQRDEVIHRIADTLIPRPTITRITEFAAVANAWTVDVVDAFAPYAAAHSRWSSPIADLRVHTIDVLLARALYLLYTAAARTVLDWTTAQTGTE